MKRHHQGEVDWSRRLGMYGVPKELHQDQVFESMVSRIYGWQTVSLFLFEKGTPYLQVVTTARSLS